MPDFLPTLERLDDLRAWLATLPLLWLAAAGAAALACGWAGAVLRKRRHSRRLLAALQSSVRGRVQPFRLPWRGGFTVTVVPPPDPFREFSVSYRPLSILDPVDLGLRLVGRPGSRLTVWAILLAPPTAELVWARGLPPNRALGARPGRTLWVHHQLELSGAEYATRGTNPAALRRAFLDLYARFGPMLLRMVLQKEGAPQVELVVNADRLDPGDMAALLATLRLAGRGAQIG